MVKGKIKDKVWNAYTLLVGMQIAITTLESDLAISSKTYIYMIGILYILANPFLVSSLEKWS